MHTPSTTTWPPIPVISIAEDRLDLTPTHSKITSGRWPVSSRILWAGFISRGSTTAVAPILSANSDRLGAGSDTTTVVAPFALHQIKVARPIGPAPITTQAEPGRSRERLTPCSPTASGSTSAPSRELNLSGILNRLFAPHRTNSA